MEMMIRRKKMYVNVQTDCKGRLKEGEREREIDG